MTCGNYSGILAHQTQLVAPLMELSAQSAGWYNPRASNTNVTLILMAILFSFHTHLHLMKWNNPNFAVCRLPFCALLFMRNNMFLSNKYFATTIRTGKLLGFMHVSLMRVAVVFHSKISIAIQALVLLFPSMNGLVYLQELSDTKWLRTMLTLKRFLVGMHSFVIDEAIMLDVSLWAKSTQIWFLQWSGNTMNCTQVWLFTTLQKRPATARNWAYCCPYSSRVSLMSAWWAVRLPVLPK